MKMTKDECMNCGAFSTLRYPDGTIKCLECGHESAPTPATCGRQSPTPAITVGRYSKTDGFPTRNFAIHVDGILLAVTVYRKGAEAVKEMLTEVLNGKALSPAPAPTPGRTSK